MQRAKGIGQKHFSLVVTAYWKGDKNHVKAYAFKDVSPRYAEGVGYPEPTPENVQAWKYGLQVRRLHFLRLGCALWASLL